jgi:hypothetical protein
MNIDLVRDALEYYDANREKYQKFLKKVKYTKLIPSKTDMEYNSIIFFDKDNNEIHTSRYELIGTYVPDYNIWSWAWSVPAFSKNSTYTVTNVLNYGIKLPPSSPYIKTELITSRFAVSDLTQLDLHVAIASYLSKMELIYNYQTSYSDDFSNYYDKDGDDEIITRKNVEDLNEIPEGLIITYMFILDYPNLD